MCICMHVPVYLHVYLIIWCIKISGCRHGVCSTSTAMYMHVPISVCMDIQSPSALWRCIYMHTYTWYYNVIHTVYGDNLYIYYVI